MLSQPLSGVRFEGRRRNHFGLNNHRGGVRLDDKDIRPLGAAFEELDVLGPDGVPLTPKAPSLGKDLGESIVDGVFRYGHGQVTVSVWHIL